MKKRKKRRPRRRPHLNGSHSLPINEETARALKSQQEKFRKKFGREPGPGDPVFFDPDSDTPKPRDMSELHSVMQQSLKEMGARPSIIYAHNKTGVLATDENWDLLSPEDQAQWNAAIEEYSNKD